MNSFLDRVLTMAKKLGYYLLQYAYTFFYWILRFLKIQLQKWNRWTAQKGVDRAYTSLGAEMYSFYKQGGDAGWQSVPSIDQQLKRVEDAEARVFMVDEIIAEIEREYLNRKEQIKGQYAARRSGLDVRSPE